MNIYRIIFMEILFIMLIFTFIQSAYSQTLSLENLRNQTVGVEVAYNQTNFKHWAQGVDAVDHNGHLSIPFRLDDYTKLSIIPCIILTTEKSDPTVFKGTNLGCYIRYSARYDTTIPEVFYRVSGGWNSYNSETKSSDIWKADCGIGASSSLLEHTRNPIKIFGGVFIGSEVDIQRQLVQQDNMGNNYNFGFDISTEFGVEVKISEKYSLSIAPYTYLFNNYGFSNFSPKVYFSMKYYN